MLNCQAFSLFATYGLMQCNAVWTQGVNRSGHAVNSLPDIYSVESTQLYQEQ